MSMRSIFQMIKGTCSRLYVSGRFDSGKRNTNCFCGENTETGYWKAVRQGVKQAVDCLNETLGYTDEDKITFTFEGSKT